ncbi:MAG: helix-turn-helix transcriptional regulator [Ekhidna sp.]|nr:helix-turn-helix transcriptional regulator [Ekhidna sp.]
MKLLREQHKLSQQQMADLFDLNVSSIKSYEGSSFPKIEVIVQITQYFKVDMNKFMTLDMQKHSVYQGEKTNINEEVRNLKRDLFFHTGLNEKQQFAFLEAMDLEELKKHYMVLFKTKEHLVRELSELQEKYIKLLEKVKRIY